MSFATNINSLTLMPIFFSGGPEVTPPKARSTMKADTLSFVIPFNYKTFNFSIKLLNKLNKF